MSRRLQFSCCEPLFDPEGVKYALLGLFVFLVFALGPFIATTVALYRNARLRLVGDVAGASLADVSLVSCGIDVRKQTAEHFLSRRMFGLSQLVWRSFVCSVQEPLVTSKVKLNTDNLKKAVRWLVACAQEPHELALLAPGSHK